MAGAWLVLAANLWGAGETVILTQSAVNCIQIGYAASEAQEKPSVSFICRFFVVGVYHASMLSKRQRGGFHFSASSITRCV